MLVWQQDAMPERRWNAVGGHVRNRRRLAPPDGARDRLREQRRGCDADDQYRQQPAELPERSCPPRRCSVAVDEPIRCLLVEPAAIRWPGDGRGVPTLS